MECTRCQQAEWPQPDHPTPLYRAEVWKPWQEAGGVHVGTAGEHREEHSSGVVLPRWLSLPNALEAWQEVQSCRSLKIQISSSWALSCPP